MTERTAWKTLSRHINHCLHNTAVYELVKHGTSLKKAKKSLFYAIVYVHNCAVEASLSAISLFANHISHRVF